MVYFVLIFSFILISIIPENTSKEDVPQNIIKQMMRKRPKYKNVINMEEGMKASEN